MKMIIGLGSPGTKYQYIKHDIDFMVMDKITREHQATFKKSPLEAETAKFFHNGGKTLLIGPQTFMNGSGRAVGPLMTYSGIYPEELVVIYDDLGLTVRKIRLRQKGSANEHNGIENITSHLNTDVFDRTEMGIGRPEGKKVVVQHVLSPSSKENQLLIEGSMCQSVKAVEYLIEGHSFVDTMNRFN